MKEKTKTNKRSALWRLTRYARYAGLPLTIGFILTDRKSVV